MSDAQKRQSERHLEDVKSRGSPRGATTTYIVGGEMTPEGCTIAVVTGHCAVVALSAVLDLRNRDIGNSAPPL
jgi:hypothetical protein